MSLIKSSTLKKALFLTSAVCLTLTSISSANAGSVVTPKPKPPIKYPAPMPPPAPTPPPVPQPPFPPVTPYPPMPPVPCCVNPNPPAGPANDFQISLDVLGTYMWFDNNNGTDTTTIERKFLELRPFASYFNNNGAVEIDASASTRLLYEIDGTEDEEFFVGESEVDLRIIHQNNLAAGITAVYDKEYFYSDTPNPDGMGSYHEVEVSGFIEKNFGQFGVSLAGTYDTDRYGETRQTGGAAAVDEAGLDEQKIGASLRVNASVSREIAVFVEGQFEKEVFATPGDPSKNHTTLGARVGGTYNLSNMVAFEVAGAYGRRVYEDRTDEPQNAWGGDAKVVASMGRTLNASLGVSGEYLINEDPDTDNTTRLKTEGEIRYTIGNDINLSADVEYDVTVSGPAEGSVLEAGAKVNYAVHDNVDLYLEGVYGYETDNDPGWIRKMGVTAGVTIHN